MVPKVVIDELGPLEAMRPLVVRQALCVWAPTEEATVLSGIAMGATSTGTVEGKTNFGPSAGLALCQYVRNGKLFMVDRGVGQAIYAASA